MSGWTAISFRFHPSLEDVVVTILQDAGTLGMQMSETGEGLQPGGAPASAGADELTATAYFIPRADLGVVGRALESAGAAVVLGATAVQDEHWAVRQERDRRPLAVGRRFLILPASAGLDERPPAEAATASRAPRISLVIPPQRAFGTGEHATTRLCLEALEELPLQGARVLDLGTGSGILAMAAARLGAREVVGLDNDPEAIEVALENLALNGFQAPASRAEGHLRRVLPGEAHSQARAPEPLDSRDTDALEAEPASAPTHGPNPQEGTHRIALGVGEISQALGSFDLIIANIYAGVIGAIAQPFAELQGEDGRLLLSGFSPPEAHDLVRRFAERGYALERSAEAGEWCAIVLVKGA